MGRWVDFRTFLGNLADADKYVADQKKTHKNLPAMTGVEKENEALSLYRIHRHYYVPNPDGTAWIVNPNNKTGVNYANKVRTLLQP